MNRSEILKLIGTPVTITTIHNERANVIFSKIDGRKVETSCGMKFTLDSITTATPIAQKPAAKPLGDQEMELIRAAHERGSRAGASMIPGALFVGAFGAADEAHYLASEEPLAKCLRSIFVGAFLEALPRPIVTDHMGIIVEDVNKAKRR